MRAGLEQTAVLMLAPNRTVTRVEDDQRYAEVVTLGDGRIRLELGVEEELISFLVCDTDDHDEIAVLSVVLHLWVDVPDALIEALWSAAGIE